MATITKELFKTHIDNFDFTNLFNQLGWNYVDDQFPVKLKDETYLFHSVAEKGGFRIIVSVPAKTTELPDYNTRLQLDRKIARLFREHLIIFCDNKQTTQIWQLFVKQLGKPSRLSETRWNKGQEPELLYQKTSNLFFTLDEEENITIADVVERVNDNFSRNVEQITKKFYENFRKEHQKFIEFIVGISAISDREWYASLMLNRLMFCYFIQKKGFLDQNLSYLRDKLNACQEKKGQNQFYSFYRNFLLLLFHQGLGAPEHNSDLNNEIGKIPYLNGGLFDEHELEKLYSTIDIDDKAFERVFDFFDQYNWHLDTRVTATGRDINPDVIGYIFEKYINDRAQMGAYYTKEDITEYIGKNCIVPYLFDETKRQYSKAFTPEAEMWLMVKNSDDEYIYPALKHGILLPSPLGEGPGVRLLPEEIQIGLDTTQPNLLERRKEWNKPAPPEFALPTEIWREVVERRERYAEVNAKIENGEITHINDFITYNLNIRQFAQDAIECTNDPDFLKAFYKALNNVTILDPTCGSGAFLFAAMSILEPLYEACIDRAERFVAECADENNYKHLSLEIQKSWKTIQSDKSWFRQLLSEVKAPEHPNLQYFIFKSIILRNLYGVDIMKEATEIAKLRLFLKLVATVEVDYRKPNLGLEPLPDIDFNIRAGNTLVGFATFDEAIRAINSKDKSGQMGLVFADELDIVNEVKNQADDLARVYASFKKAQLDDNLANFKAAKDKLIVYQKRLNNLLNEYLAYTYGIESKTQKEKYAQWMETHQPFHWFAEYYDMMQGKGGFDIVIGNPPYVEYKDVKGKYSVIGYESFDSSDLYAFVMERSLFLSNEFSRSGFIIPMSCFTVDGFSSIQKLYYRKNSSLHISNWSGDAHPSKLFEGVDKRLHIVISQKAIKNYRECKTYVTKYIKWYSEERQTLFDIKPKYFLLDRASTPIFNSSLPKISELNEEIILDKLKRNKTLASFQSISATYNIIYYTRKVSFFLQFLNFIPTVIDSTGTQREPSELKQLYFENSKLKNAVLSCLNSSIFYWFFIINSDCRNLNKREIVNFYIPKIDEFNSECFEKILNDLMNDYNVNSSLRTVSYKNKGEITVQYFNFRLSKPIIDEIDKVLAVHYGFTDEELDFIINYDIKYRMGKELEEE
jgi:hypothetical protein